MEAVNDSGIAGRRKVKAHAEEDGSGGGGGSIRQAWAAALQRELAGMYQLMAQLDAMAGNPRPTGVYSTLTGSIWLLICARGYTCKARMVLSLLDGNWGRLCRLFPSALCDSRFAYKHTPHGMPLAFADAVMPSEVHGQDFPHHIDQTLLLALLLQARTRARRI